LSDSVEDQPCFHTRKDSFVAYAYEAYVHCLENEHRRLISSSCNTLPPILTKPTVLESARNDLTASYWALSAELTDHIGLLTTAMLRASFALDSEQGITLKCSLATALSARAALHSLLATHRESVRMSLRDVSEVAGIVSGINERDFKYMDAVMGVSSCSFLEGNIITQTRLSVGMHRLLL
jgi:hypothetical protein